LAIWKECDNNSYSCNVVVPVIAYLIKYKEIIVEYEWYHHHVRKNERELDVAKSENGKKYYKMKKIVDWGILKVAKTLSTAPWIGGSADYYEGVVKELLKLHIIEQFIFVDNSKCKISYYLNIDAWNLGDNYNQLIDVIKNEWKLDVIERNDYILTINKDIGEEFLDKIENEINEDKFVTIKISTFHAQELLNIEIIKTRILDMLRRYPNMFLQIMVIGKKSSNIAKENADMYSFESVYRNGIAEIYRGMKECRDRVIVKSVPDDDDIARFRGIIVLCENDIIYCSQVWWRFGMDRGVYKAVLTTESDNSFSRNFNNLFTKYFNLAICENRLIVRIWYKMRHSVIKPMLIMMATAFVANAIMVLISQRTWDDFNDEFTFVSILTTALFYYVPKWYYFIKRKFFII